MGLTAIVGATVIDGSGGVPVPDAVVLIEDGRIRYVAPAAEATPPAGAEVIDAHGHHVIPGLLDANVHLFAGLTPDLLLEHEGDYERIVEEAAQVALKAGVTTVFDTWGPLDPLIAVRERINRGETPGSRMFVAGNIIGLDGPLSVDFLNAGAALGADTVARIDEQWQQGVGADLLWLTPEQIRRRVRDYLERSDVDIVKYAASGHALAQMRFITFSAEAQRTIVEEAHRAGRTVQAHTTSPESLRMAIEAGVDLLQHPDVTGAAPMPEELLRIIVERELPVAALVCTERYLEWVRQPGRESLLLLHDQKDGNDRRLIASGARLLLTTDAFAWGPRCWNHPLLLDSHQDVVDEPTQLGQSHLRWLEAVVERGMAPMTALVSATGAIAEAYQVADDLGTLTPGRRADLLILAGDPLTDVRAYRRITHVLKDGEVVDRAALPMRRVLTEADSELEVCP